MFTHRHTIRQGLPRVANGDPWPPADTLLPVDDLARESPGADEALTDAAGPADDFLPPTSPDTLSRGIEVGLRQGLPREAGGKPWPPEGRAPAISGPAASSRPAGAEVGAETAASILGDQPAPGMAPATGLQAAGGPGSGRMATDTVRRGLPRARGGDAWPTAETVAAVQARPAPEAQASITAVTPPPVETTATPGRGVEPPTVQRSRLGTSRAASVRSPAATPRPREAAEPAPVQQERTQKDARRYGPYTALQWTGVAALGVVAVCAVLGGLVLLVRFLLGLDPMQDFMARYPGEYHLPEATPVGFPAWLGWQHFFNAFLMLLIIRTGIQIRTEKRPTAYWAPKSAGGSKVSLTVWLHQSMDLLWLANGVIFVVLLAVTGHWARIVPTSWEVFPNALSAMLQYISLDWPTENGWVNYNSLQQLAYFTTVFIAAPLSALTGLRMSGLWPKDNTVLTKSFPVEWARKLHFPVMVYFVAFIVIHVSLVFATGALRNLNHMYAAQGSLDGVAYAENWTGFWIFVVSLVVMAGGWVAARPMVVAPIARLFGTVSSR